MPKRIISLSEANIKNAKPRENDYKLTNGGRALFAAIVNWRQAVEI